VMFWCHLGNFFSTKNSGRPAKKKSLRLCRIVRPSENVDFFAKTFFPVFLGVRVLAGGQGDRMCV
jgi:hypothetical protein